MLIFWKEPIQTAIKIIRGKKYAGVAVISDSNVISLYANTFVSCLKKAKLPCSVIEFPAGDSNKTRSTKEKIEDSLLKTGAGRDWVIVALGGGVTGDIAGFTASTFMRGIDWINIPTSLLSMVDASLGGKTGVNTPSGKNLIGTFHNPVAIIISETFLQTLPHLEWLNGIAEIIKHAVIMDRKFFEFLERVLPIGPHSNRKIIRKIIRRSIEIKKSIVKQDERELSIRSILNFGHTVGHAIEKSSEYKISHGRAVATGILVEAAISMELGLFPRSSFKRLTELLIQAGFKSLVQKKFSSDLIYFMRTDKKKRMGKINFVLIKDIGKVYSNKNLFTFEVPEKTLKKVLNRFGLKGLEY